MNPLIAAAAINTGGSFLSGLFGGKSKEEKEEMMRRAQMDRAENARANLGVNQKTGSLAAMTPYRGTMMNAMFNKLGIAPPQGGPDLTKYNRPQVFDPEAQEVRQRIMRETEGAPFRGQFREDALRRHDIATRQGQGGAGFDVNRLFGGMKERDPQMQQMNRLPSWARKKFGV